MLHAADSLNVFKSGDTARAADVNANFKLIWERLNSLNEENKSLKKTIDTLKAGKAPLEKIEQIEARLVNLPKGTLIASVTKPGLDGYMPNSDQTWMIAAGPARTINDVPIPELRGRFLRAINFPAVGTSSLKDSSDTENRSPGEYQEDQYKEHGHTQRYGSGATGSDSDIAMRASAMGNLANTMGSGGSETRPRNIAAYFYIKVK